MKFKYTILYVEDVGQTLGFYERAFDCKIAMHHDSGDFGALDTGATTLAFSSVRLMQDLGKNPSRPQAGSPCFEIAFETEQVELALDRAVSAGATLIQAVRDEPWGQTTAYVTDINGFLVEICSPLRPQS